MRDILLITAAVTLSLPAAADDVKGQAARQWSDNTGNFSVTATLVEVDAAEQSVTLRLDSGKIVHLPIRRLSVKDREHLDVVAGEPDTPETVQIAGVDWFEDVRDAKQAAAGKATPDDDKPIMCFRVLGELNGFM